MNKKIASILFLLLICIQNVLAEPSGRGYDPNAPDLGLPGGNEVLTGIIIAIIAIPVGYLIMSAGNNDKGSDGNTFTGCLGLLLVGGGVICLLPLLAWIFTILSGLYAIGFIIFIIIVVIALLFSKDK